jgi:hypothetical protein
VGFSPPLMKRYPVNLVKNDDPECARELKEQAVKA